MTRKGLLISYGIRRDQKQMLLLDSLEALGGYELTIPSFQSCSPEKMLPSYILHTFQKPLHYVPQ